MTAPRILIVDDSAVLVELSAFVLELAGFTVDATMQAANAVSRVAVFRPDLILMDVQMPDIDGVELMRRLKADPDTKHIVVIAFTALAMKGDESRMRLAGFDGYVAKPFDAATLAATIRLHLANRDLPALSP